MSSTPLVCIILVNYKSVQHTIECIESLKQIIYPNYKIIVVDNYSQDDSVEKLKEYKNSFVLIESKSNTGFAGGNNLAIDYAMKNNADYVLLLNNDTTVEPNFLDELIRKTSPEIGINIGKILFYYDKSMLWYAGGQINKLKGCTDVNGFKKDNGQYDKEESVTFASGCCMLISKEVIKNVGMLKEEYFLYFEDTDYCARVLKNGYKILYCPKSVIYHKESVSTIKDSFEFLYYFTRNRLYFIKNNIRGLNKLLSYIHSNIFIFTKAIVKKQAKKPILFAYRDFLKNKKGKLLI